MTVKTQFFLLLRFWDGTICVKLRNIFEYCRMTTDCHKGMECYNNKCNIDLAKKMLMKILGNFLSF